MPAVKVGVIGCGSIAQWVHLRVLARMPDVMVTAVAEADAHRCEEACRRAPGAVAFADYRELLERADVEAVVICLPNALHAPAAVAALEHGKHVYLEKPIAQSCEEAQAILAAWRTARVIGMTGFNYRFNPLYEAARQAIRSGELGELVGLRSVFSAAARPLIDWKRSRASGGGALLHLGSHHVDLVQHFTGQRVREVSATVRSQRGEGDSAMLQMRMADGLLVQSFFSYSAVDDDHFDIYGRAGKLSVDRHFSMNVTISEPMLKHARLERLARGVRSLVHAPYLLEKLREPGYEPSYRRALGRFAAAVRGRAPASPDFSDGYRSLQIIEAAEESARTGSVVCVAEDAARTGGPSGADRSLLTLGARHVNT